MTRLASTLALFAVMMIAGCRQSQPTSATGDSLQIAVTVEPNPPISGKAQLVVTLRDASGNPISGTTLTVRGDMTHAGMTPVIRDGVTGQNGVYTVPFEWTMDGDWIVEVTAKLKDGTTTTRMFKYSVSEGSGDMSMELSATAEATPPGIMHHASTAFGARVKPWSGRIDQSRPYGRPSAVH